MDTSFLVAPYIRDSHSPEVIRRMAEQPITWITPLNRAEAAHAIQHYVFRKAISTADAKVAWSNFERDCDSGLWIEVDLPDTAWGRSIALAQQYWPDAWGANAGFAARGMCAGAWGAELLDIR